MTNPAIDPLREGLVMGLDVNIGKRGNLLDVGPDNVSSQVSEYEPFLSVPSGSFVKFGSGALVFPSLPH